MRLVPVDRVLVPAKKCSKKAEGMRQGGKDEKMKHGTPTPRGDGNCAEAIERIGVGGGVEWQKSALRGLGTGASWEDGRYYPRVFCIKNSKLLEKAGDSVSRSAKEFGRVSKQKRWALQTNKERDEARRKRGSEETGGAGASESRGRIAWNLITVKVQYYAFTIRT